MVDDEHVLWHHLVKSIFNVGFVDALEHERLFVDELNILRIFYVIQFPSQGGGGGQRTSLRDVGEVYHRLQLEFIVNIILNAFTLDLVYEHVDYFDETEVVFLAFLCGADVQ